MKITPDELVTLMGRIREEEKFRASTILAERDQDLIRKLGKFREEAKSLPDEECSRAYRILDELDPRPSGPPGTSAEHGDVMKKRYPSMFKGGPP